MSLSLAAVGDVMLGDHPFRIGHGVGSVIRRRGPLHPFVHVASVLRNADIRFCNLEAVLSNSSDKSDYLESAQMRGEPRAAVGLAYAGFQIVSMANNHAMDHGRAANVQTRETLREHGVECVGPVEGRSPHKILEAGGASIAFLAYSFVGATTIHPWCNKQVLTMVEEDIRRARKDADFVVVSAHWGREFVDRPSPHVYWLAHEMVDYGADVVLGHHPHVIQGIETYRGKLVAYSLGNFVSDMWADARETFILRVHLQEGEALSYDIVPVRIGSEYQPIPEVGEPSRRIARRVSILSQQLDYSTRQADIDQQAKQYELQARYCRERYRIIMRRYFLMNMYRYPPRYLVHLIRNSVLWHLK